MTNIAMIPARMGSQRLKRKNLELFEGVPLLEYAIRRCIDADIFEKIIVNSEDEVFKNIADRNGVDFYHREASLADSVATSEEFIADFFDNIESDSVFQVHSITPLLGPGTLRRFVEFCSENEFNTVLTCVEDQIEVAYKGSPVNFCFSSKTNSQDLLPTQRITWAATYWRRKAFLANHEESDCGTYSAPVGFFPVPAYSGLAIKTKEDLVAATALKGAGVV